MHTYKFGLISGGTARAEVVADFVRCMSATGSFTLRINGGTRLENFGAGLSYQVAPGELIRSIVIEDTSGAANEIALYAGAGTVADNRLTLTSGATISLTPGAQVDVIAPNSWDQFLKSPPAGACVLAMAANPNRRELIITNSGSADQWIRPNLTATPGGILLAAGAVIAIKSAGAFYVFNPGPGSVTTFWAEFFA
jgi:hypothetical protein